MRLVSYKLTRPSGNTIWPFPCGRHNLRSPRYPGFRATLEPDGARFDGESLPDLLHGCHHPTVSITRTKKARTAVYGTFVTWYNYSIIGAYAFRTKDHVE